MTHIRRKGVAIVDTKKGILVVSGRSKVFSLPGGGANKGESRKKATIRELREETGLKTKSARYLFRYEGKKWRMHNGRICRNHAKVFLINSYGRVRPRHEIKNIAFYNINSKNVKISKRTLDIINKYIDIKDNRSTKV